MKTVAIFSLALILTLSAQAETMQAYKIAKVFKGPEGEKITLVYLEPRDKNELLIKFENVEGEWDNKIILHQRVSLGGDKEDYRVKDSDPKKIYNSIVYRGYGYEVYLKGAKRKPLRVSYSEQDSKQVNVTEIVTEYQKSAK